ncbi:ubiquinol-cytochrome c reductase core subunit 1 [Serendipita sp. 401]|nr:ubiquinol-cytochrome c reductase core subunit 1 [Serendipita sp. 401]KAG9052112.1 ubiquinol-cytochrome c reductase core subunit 1 [Serendipita sp. 407]
MLAAVRSPCRRGAAVASNAIRHPRSSFATAVDVGGLKVATVDNGQPSASVTVLVKAGSRYESKPGVAHFLKNFAFKNTADRSALRIARESEYYGGVLSSSLGREHLALTAEFLKGDEAFFVDVLSSILTSTRFTPHEFAESVLPSVQAESSEAAHDPALTAVEIAHALAFRKGLGSSLFASPAGPTVTPEDVKAFASSAFSKSGISILGTGIDSSVLAKLVEKSLSSLPASGSSGAASVATKSHGGESRVLAETHGTQTVFVGYGSVGAPSPELSVLAAHLSASPSVKWSDGTSSTFTNLPQGSKVQTVLLPYSDATLFGFLVQAPTSEGVLQAGKAVVAGLKEASGSSSIRPEAWKKAVAKAKFAAATALDTRQGLLDAIALQTITGAKADVQSTFASIEKVSAQSAASTLSKLTKSKPVYVAIGDIQSLPYADELGL